MGGVGAAGRGSPEDLQGWGPRAPLARRDTSVTKVHHESLLVSLGFAPPTVITPASVETGCCLCRAPNVDAEKPSRGGLGEEGRHLALPSEWGSSSESQNSLRETLSLWLAFLGTLLPPVPQHASYPHPHAWRGRGLAAAAGPWPHP